MDAGNLLKPMLARGELHCIGATTLDEYRKHIEKDAALERRFQPVPRRPADGRGHDLDPARPARALRGAPRRAHPGHRAGGRRGALATATSPTASCRTRRSTSSTRPAPAAHRDRLDARRSSTRSTRRVMQLEIEARRCARRRTRRSKTRLEHLRARARRPPRAQADAMRAQWEQREGGDRRGPRQLREEHRAAAASRSRQAERAYDLEPRRRAALRARCAELEKQLAERGRRDCASQAPDAVAAQGGGRPRTRSPRSSRAGPASRSPGWSRASARSCCAWTRSLHERVVGQDEAVAAVADADPPARAGHQGPAAADRLVHLPRPHRRRQDRAGPGARRVLFDTEENIVRIDMTEYMEKHTVSRLIGAPPGYVGYDEGGQLTEAVRRQPYSRGALRRDREGAPRRLQRAAADPRRRPPHRLAGPHRRLQEHRHHHDLQHRLGDLLEAATPGADAFEGAAERVLARAARALPARVPEPRRRDHRLPAARRDAAAEIVDLQIDDVQRRLAATA